MLLAIIIGIVQGLVLYLLRDTVIEFFTTDTSVKAQMKTAWSLFIVFAFFDTT